MPKLAPGPDSCCISSIKWKEASRSASNIQLLTSVITMDVGAAVARRFIGFSSKGRSTLTSCVNYITKNIKVNDITKLFVNY